MCRGCTAHIQLACARAGCIARAGGGAYGGTIFPATARVARRGEPLDWLLVPGVFAVMHVSWGVGFMSGCWRLGPPAEGLRRVARGLRARLRSSS